MDVKSLILLGPGACTIKSFTFVIYELLKSARVFVPDKLFQPSQMLRVRPGAYTRVEQLKGASLG